MGKNQSASGLTNIVQYDIAGNISLVSGSTTLLYISSSGAIITTGVISGSNALSASYSISASNTLAAQTASYVQNAQSASYVLTSQTASFVLNAQSASYVLNAQSASNAVVAQTASYVLTAQTASFVANAQSASNAVAAQTASYANNLTVAGTLTAQTLVVQTITSSVSTITGSTQFGSTGSNTHVFTGSIYQTGSIATFAGSVGIGTSSPSYSVDSFTPSGSGTGNLGRFYYSDGTYNPRLQITGDSTGITFFESYSTGANTLKFSIAGSNTLVLKGDNVGIGTTNPSGLLQIGGSDSSGTLYVTASVNQNAVRLRNNNASFATIDIANADSTGYGIYAAGGKHYFSGNVGMGTTSPKTILDVYSNSDIWHAMIGGNTSKLLVGGQASAGIILQGGSGSMVYNQAVSSPYNIILQRDGGNVGIGTTSLSEKLTVSGSIALVGNYSIKSDFEGVTFLQHNVSDGNFWTWQEQSAGWGHFVGNRNSQLNALGGIMAGSGLGSFLTNSANGWSLAPLSGSLSAYATIAFDHNFGKAYFSGSVGIGTTSPTLANLQVNGSGNTTVGFIGAPSMTTGQSVFFQVGKNQSAINNAGELSFKYVGDDDASNMVSLGFYGNGQKLNILKNGNVGIGTTNPIYKLHLTGSNAMLKIESSGASFSSPSINLLQGAIDTVLSATNNGLEVGTWSAHDIILKTTQVERLRISSSGVKFQNSPSYLNYYDEGTWTPIFNFDSGSPYTGTTLRYIRIGKLLFLHGQTACDTSGRSGGITVTGLPFTLETGTGQGSNDCYLAIWGLNDNCYSYGYPGYSLNSTSLALYVHGGPSLGSARYFPLTVANCNLSTVYVSFMNTFVCA